MLQDVIQEIEATRSGWRCIDINFKINDTSRVAGYEVYALPEDGRIRKRFFPSESLSDSQCLTMKFLRNDVAYTFEVHVMYKDNTYSKPAQTKATPPLRATSSNLAGFLAKKFSDFSISPLTCKGRRENTLIKWEFPEFEDPLAYEIMGVRVKIEKDGSDDVREEIMKPEETKCKVFLEQSHFYRISVIWRYWDVDADAESEKIELKHWQAGKHDSGSSNEEATANEAEISSEIRFYYTKEKEPMKEGKFVFSGQFSYIHKDFRDKSVKQSVAIKILGADVYDGQIREYGTEEEKEKLAKRMVREAKHMLELVHHPNIVRYIHCCQGEEDRRHFLIFMERCSEKTLQDRIEDSLNHPEFNDSKYCKAIICHLTLAVHYMHTRSKPIYHRDIKPSNVLFTTDSRIVKLSDFGFSKKATKSDGGISSTSSNGTDGYRPPETYDEKRHGRVNDRVDVFSLGLVKHYILTKGKHAFGSQVYEQQQNIVSKNPPAVEGLTGLDAALAKDLILRMIRVDQSERPNMDDVIKHPYFWDVDKVVGFYIKFTDCLKGDSECSWKTKSEVVEFFQMSADAAKVAVEIIPRASDESSDRMPIQRIVEREIEQKMQSWKIYEDFSYDAKLYIQIICEISSRLESDNTRQDSDEESDGSSDSDTSLERDEKGSSEHTPESADDIMPRMEWNNLDRAMAFIEDATDLPNKSNAPSVVHDISNKTFIELSSADRERIQTLGPLQNVPMLIENIEKVMHGSSFSIVFERGGTPTESINTTSKSRCAVDWKFSLPNEFITQSERDNLEAVQRGLQKASTLNENNEEKLKRVTSEAFKFIGIQEANRKRQGNLRKKQKVIGGDTRNTADHMSLEKANDKIQELNSLSIKRKSKSDKDWSEFKKLVYQLTSTDTNNQCTILRSIIFKAAELFHGECEGSEDNWKTCFKQASDHHKECTNCPCIELASKAENAGDEIFDMVMFIRNKLVHLEENKRKTDGRAIATQEKLLNFVASAVPELLLHMVEIMKDDLKQYMDDNKLENSSFILPKVKEVKEKKARYEVHPSGDVDTTP